MPKTYELVDERADTAAVFWRSDADLASFKLSAGFLVAAAVSNSLIYLAVSFIILFDKPN